MLLDKRDNYLPFDYPEVQPFIDKIQQSYWIHSEINFDADMLEYSRLSESEQGIIRRAMLAISQIEVAVKNFWGSVYLSVPKPEINNVGACFSDAEARHADTYSRLLTILGLEHQFSEFLEHPTAKNRYSWLEKPRNDSPENIAYNVAIFSMLIENVSLFSQFLILLSFNRHLGVMRNIANGISWTSADETVHYEFGAWLVNKLMQEYPEIDANGFRNKMRSVAHQALEHEIKMLDYILGGDELSFLSRDTIIHFIKHRLNKSLYGIGIDSAFEMDEEEYKKTQWFDELVNGTGHKDFFALRPTEYSVKDVVFTGEELF